MLIVAINNTMANQATSHFNQWALIQNQKLVIEWSLMQPE
jgi:hypothetical protein